MCISYILTQTCLYEFVTTRTYENVYTYFISLWDII